MEGGQVARIGKASKAAGGWGALKSCGKHLLSSGSPVAGAKALLAANQPDGFDCPGCAWGDPEHGSSFEFCENGVKAVAWEATGDRASPKVLSSRTVSEMHAMSEFELERLGRLTHPMRYDRASDRYVETTWDEAFAGIAAELRALNSPDEAEFYTSGRASNEAAFVYQLMVRMFGTNNFPDCSNMCHEASGVGLGQSIGAGKGTVTLEDFDHADAILVIGQNPGTNHPRMLAELRKAEARGARIVVLNTLKERGLQRFSDPQDALEMATGGSRPIAGLYLQPKLGGDMAAVRGVAKEWLYRHRKALEEGRTGLVDLGFVAGHTAGFASFEAAVDATSWEEILDQSGLTRSEISEAADAVVGSKRLIATWAMGVTQHRHSVATVREIANLLFLGGHIGREGAGLCPVRGHSNVQGDRTMGITEAPSAAFLDALDAEFGIESPRSPGHSVVEAIEAMAAGRSRFFMGLGGNFGRAAPDTAVTEAALSSCRATVHVATKPNHTHMKPGEVSWLLPCLGRTEIQRNAAGRVQIVTVEDSMSMVHGSGGINAPASPHLLSEVAIVAGIARALLGDGPAGWTALAEDHDLVRDAISRVVPGFESFNERVRRPRGFRLRNPASHLEWRTPSGRAEFSGAALPQAVEHQSARATPGVLVLQTLRSHDQYNTTVYGLDDRYRGVRGGRRVVFLNADDAQGLGFAQGDLVDVVGVHPDGVRREARGFQVVIHDTPRGCAAGYYPELNAVAPLSERGEGSLTPISKAIPVRLERAA